MSFQQIASAESVVSASPLPSVEELNKFYAESYYQNPQSSSYQTSYPEWELRHKMHKADVLMKVLSASAGRPFVATTDTFLDIGCGEGFVLAAASRSGLQVTGFDFSEFGIRKFHPELLDRFKVGDAMELLDQVRAETRQFDFCSTINVLEHVIDHDRFLKAISSVCKTSSLIAMTVPNDFSRLQKRLQELNLIDREYWFSPPAHLHYFNTENLPGFLMQRGFEVVDMYSDFPIDLFLFHPGSNYITDPANGPDAHRARIEADLMLAESGDEPYLNLCRAMARCGLGRDFTVIAKLAS